jgi:hypothetical protein
MTTAFNHTYQSTYTDPYNIQHTGPGWRDMVADLVRAQATGGGVTLSLAALAGNVLSWKYTAAAGVGNGLSISFHVDHDLARAAANRKGYIHVHHGPVAAGQTGTSVWKFEYVLAKGHSQAAFPTSSTTITLTSTSSATQNQHQIIEDTVGIDLLEPDTLIHGYLWRDGAAGSDAGAHWCYYCDFHYQTDRDMTSTKAPPWDP